MQEDEAEEVEGEGLNRIQVTVQIAGAHTQYVVKPSDGVL